jgi:hypothetical protein
VELGQEGFVHFSNLPVITYVTSRIIWHDLLRRTPLLRRRLQGLFGQSFQLEARSEIGEGTTGDDAHSLAKAHRSWLAVAENYHLGSPRTCAKLRSVLMWTRIRAVIIEDEPLAAQYLAALLDDTCQVDVIGSAIEE